MWLIYIYSKNRLPGSRLQRSKKRAFSCTLPLWQVSWKRWKLEVIWLFHTSATIGQVSCLRLPVRLSSDLLLLLPNIEKNCIHILHWHSCYTHCTHKDKNKETGVFFHHLPSLMLPLFEFRKQTCAHISYSDALLLCSPTVQPRLLRMMLS